MQAFGEGFLFNEIFVHSQVLPFAMNIGKFQIDQFDSFVVDLAKDVLRCLGHGRQVDEEQNLKVRAPWTLRVSADTKNGGSFQVTVSVKTSKSIGNRL